MPVLSYLVSPVRGAKKKLINDLNAMEFCEVIPSENMEVIILVTDTPDEESEKKLQENLKHLNTLQTIAMVFGHACEN